MQRGMFRSAVVLVSSLAMGSLLLVVAEQMNPGAAAKAGVQVSSTAPAKATAATATKLGAVRVWEEKVVIPTYLHRRAGAQSAVLLWRRRRRARSSAFILIPPMTYLTTEKVDKTYKMVYLENEYIKIGILPESGGQDLSSAVDKTNGYKFIYNQHVIKPALISLLGAWISGGDGVGHSAPPPRHDLPAGAVHDRGERPTAPRPCWVGELELRDRMRWTVGLTLRPGKSYLEASFRMVNRTPVPTSMLCFANVAVHVERRNTR